MSYQEIIRLLEADGWYQIAQKGSHKQFKHPVKAGKVRVSGHGSKDIKKGTEIQILKQAGLR